MSHRQWYKEAKRPFSLLLIGCYFSWKRNRYLTYMVLCVSTVCYITYTMYCMRAMQCIQVWFWISFYPLVMCSGPGGRQWGTRVSPPHFLAYCKAHHKLADFQKEMQRQIQIILWFWSNYYYNWRSLKCRVRHTLVFTGKLPQYLTKLDKCSLCLNLDIPQSC